MVSVRLSHLFLLSLFCITALPAFGMEPDGQPQENNTLVSTSTYYLCHLATAAAAMKAGSMLEKLTVKHTGPIPEDISSWSPEIWLAGAACLYIIYKAPQWTDKLLGIKRERSLRNKVGGFLCRAMVPYPAGVVIHEFLTEKHD